MKQKIKDLVNARSCNVSKGFDEDNERISGGECHRQNYKQGIRCNTYVCLRLSVLFILYTTYKGLAVGLAAPFSLVLVVVLGLQTKVVSYGHLWGFRSVVDHFGPFVIRPFRACKVCL